MFEKLKQRYRQFKEWQRRPHQVKPLSDVEHDCATCGTHYQGNYCPRCGQSWAVGRYSFKNALLLFLDVWGLGNRGMFCSLRDLLLRPGYMIRDYLRGMQMAYFPPFKMFFLLVAFSVVVDSGFNIRGENRFQMAKDDYASSYTTGVEIANDQMNDPKTDAAEKEKAKVAVKTIGLARQTFEWIQDHQTYFQLLVLLVLSGPLYLFFRHSPNYPDIRYSEFFVAMVYSNNMMTMVSTALCLFCVSPSIESLCVFLALIPLKQLSGYSYKRTILNSILAALVVFFAFMLLLAIGAAIAAMVL